MLRAWFMLGDSIDNLSCINFPNFRVAVSSAWSDPSSIWRNWNVPYNIIVARECNHGLIIACTKIPNFNAWITRCCSNEVRIFIVGNAGDVGLVSLQYVGLLSVKIPNVYRAVFCSREKILAQIIESDTANIRRMRREC